MNLSEKIKILCVRSNLSVSELARLTGNTPQNFHGKMKRESFTQKDLELIASKTNSTYNPIFILENGDKI